MQNHAVTPPPHGQIAIKLDKQMRRLRRRADPVIPTSAELDPGNAAVDLLRRWREHRNDDCASLNTLFAVFGVASPLGRFADTSAFNNPAYPSWLEDVAYDHGVTMDQVHREGWNYAPGKGWGSKRRSLCAQRMIECGLSRSNGRRVPMSSAAREALLNYYRETLSLLREIERVSDRGRRENRQIRAMHARAIGRHIRAVETALQRIAEGMPPAQAQNRTA